MIFRFFLFYAIYYISKSTGDIDIVHLLEGADVNAQNKLGLTPLMQAASHNNPELVHYLLEQGADPAVQDSRGRTALDFAKVYPPREECIKLL